MQIHDVCIKYIIQLSPLSHWARGRDKQLLCKHVDQAVDFLYMNPSKLRKKPPVDILGVPYKKFNI